MMERLFHVQDSDRPMWVAAPNYTEALRRWEMRMRSENEIGEGEPVPPPDGITAVCEPDEFLPPSVDMEMRAIVRECVLALWPKTSEPMMPEVVERLPDAVRRLAAAMPRSCPRCGAVAPVFDPPYCGACSTPVGQGAEG